MFTNAPATKPVRKAELIRSVEFPFKFNRDTLTPDLIPNETFFLSVVWLIADNERMKNTVVSSSTNFRIAV